MTVSTPLLSGGPPISVPAGPVKANVSGPTSTSGTETASPAGTTTKETTKEPVSTEVTVNGQPVAQGSLGTHAAATTTTSPLPHPAPTAPNPHRALRRPAPRSPQGLEHPGTGQFHRARRLQTSDRQALQCSGRRRRQGKGQLRPKRPHGLLPQPGRADTGRRHRRPRDTATEAQAHHHPQEQLRPAQRHRPPHTPRDPGAGLESPDHLGAVAVGGGAWVEGVSEHSTRPGTRASTEPARQRPAGDAERTRAGDPRAARRVVYLGRLQARRGASRRRETSTTRSRCRTGAWRSSSGTSQAMDTSR